jgi:tol-pal system protein YbgF
MQAYRLSFPIVLALLLAAAMPVAAQKERDMIRDLQRDVALLQDNVRMLNTKFDEKIAVLTTLLQQALDEAKSANRSVAVLDSRIRESVKEQQSMISAPVAAVGTKVDQLSSDFLAVRESVNDVSSRVSKLQAQLTDINTAIRTMKTEVPPPAAPQSGPPQGISAQKLYEDAMRDKQGGNLDLALDQFRQYLTHFPTTDLAPNAQFYVGEILYYKQDYDGAIQAFDLVLEKYDENNKSPDALYMKGMALFKSERKSQAGQIFAEVIKKYPTAEVATKAKGMRRALGLPVSAAPTGKKRK